MLLSPPFLPGGDTEGLPRAWLDAAMEEVIGEGGYPVGRNLCWHGGVHLVAPEVGGAALPVVAIASGEVLLARQARDVDPAATHPLNYTGGSTPGWTSDGVVVLRHDLELGADPTTGVAVTARFYSIYHHLSSHPKTITPGARVHRATPIGTAGSIAGTPNRIHLEIACDDDNLRLLAGRTTGDLPVDAPGRLGVVFGDAYIRLPAGTPWFAQQPSDANPVAHAPGARGARLGVAGTLSEPHFVGLHFRRGDLTLTVYGEDGRIRGVRDEAQGEYGLHRRAGAISRAFPAATRPPQSAILEMLRWGRVVHPAAEVADLARVPHWKQIVLPTAPAAGEALPMGWVNLNNHTPGLETRAFSDGDLPQWRQWRIYDDDPSAGDSRCDSAAIKDLLDTDSDRAVTPEEARIRLVEPAVRERLRRAICTVPPHWDAGAQASQWSWLNTASAENPHPLVGARYDAFLAHVMALCFELPELSTATRRFHPRGFIETFGRCRWLSAEDLERIYPTTPAATRELYRLSLNQVMRRYGLNTARRAAHLFGQGAVESFSLRVMMEGSVSFARNPGHASYASEAGGWYSNPADLYRHFHNYERAGNGLGNVERSDLRDMRNRPLPVVLGNGNVVASPTVPQVNVALSRVGDGMKFRGRGFKQLTGRDNYAQYWVYRGWLRAGVDFDQRWWDPPRPGQPARRPAPIENPQLISTVPFNCIDSAGFFVSTNSIPQRADQGVEDTHTDAVSRIVNRWDEPSFQRRGAATRSAHASLTP